MSLFLQALGDSSNVEAFGQSGSNWVYFWFIIAALEFIIIIFLLWRVKKIRSELGGSLEADFFKEAKKADIDMNNLMNSINGAKELYLELSRKCHPDLFINTGKHAIAEEIFQEITANKRNYEKLVQLKIRAGQELQITF